jgi:murein DD-endopeptidase MepM/ murein hydrolase activator NlpD
LPLIVLAIIFATAMMPTSAAAERSIPILSLPTPLDEPWKIIQGYACGTHNSWDRYSLDLAASNGHTYGAPVRAAADGVVFVWVKKSGTLILHHGNGFYTMYTHMSSVVTTQDGAFIARGSVIGAVGDRAAPGVPHLHFTAFTADGSWARNRRSVPVTFAEGNSFAEIGGCSQHQGTVVTATHTSDPVASRDTTAPTLTALAAPLRVATGQPTLIEWPAAHDDADGIAGYRLYIGPDPAGTSDWFVSAPNVELPALAIGPYLLRIQALDVAGNQGEWLTVGQIVVE